MSSRAAIGTGRMAGKMMAASGAIAGDAPQAVAQPAMHIVQP
jgi:hypothetical protein